MSGIKKAALLLGDLIILYASLSLTLILRYGLKELYFRMDAHIAPFSIIFILWVLIFYLSDMYHDKSLRDRESVIRHVFWGVLISGISSVIIFYLFGDFFVLTPKTNLFVFALVFFLLNGVWRILASNLFSSGAWSVAVMGNSPLVIKTVEYLKNHPHAGYKVTEWKKDVGIEDFKRMTELVERKEIQFLVLQTKFIKDPQILTAAYHLLSLETNVMSFPAFYEMLFGKVPLEELDERWFIENITTRKKVYDLVKNLLDFIFAFILGIIFFPLLIIFFFVIKATSSGPAIFSQERVGKNGRKFILYKLRTMQNGKDGPLWTEENDSRITSFGKFLRFTHLDELPQLWNILKGDISVTGPRPERVELVSQYAQFPYYEMRHIVKPGLSGWAQINFRPSSSLEEAKEKLEYDIYYVKNRSFLLDILIILKTLRYVFTRTT